MAVVACKVPFGGILFVVALVLTRLSSAYAQSLSPAQPPATGDGTSIDQGIAYVLMLLALVLTYIIHSADLYVSL
ncbi:arabinogalactan protein 41 [Cucumis sativus]|uniref:Arabinogalactan peptide 16 n=1 Tax=Cucumis sativus TaxID=3659 RepID=A0A0A0KK44_CUCSA|nr:arabinogalactan protein 41 [Cucumis sativus]KGN50035.1 hypothetical protein Csa_000543 [Cucumis sativus]